MKDRMDRRRAKEHFDIIFRDVSFFMRRGGL